MNPADVLERSINSIDIQNYILNTIRMLLVPVFILKLADLFVCSSESKASEYTYIGQFLWVIRLLIMFGSSLLIVASFKFGLKLVRPCFFSMVVV